MAVDLPATTERQPRAAFVLRDETGHLFGPLADKAVGALEAAERVTMPYSPGLLVLYAACRDAGMFDGDAELRLAAWALLASQCGNADADTALPFSLAVTAMRALDELTLPDPAGLADNDVGYFLLATAAAAVASAQDTQSVMSNEELRVLSALSFCDSMSNNPGVPRRVSVLRQLHAYACAVLGALLANSDPAPHRYVGARLLWRAGVLMRTAYKKEALDAVVRGALLAPPGASRAQAAVKWWQHEGVQALADAFDRGDVSGPGVVFEQVNLVARGQAASGDTDADADTTRESDEALALCTSATEGPEKLVGAFMAVRMDAVSEEVTRALLDMAGLFKVTPPLTSNDSGEAGAALMLIRHAGMALLAQSHLDATMLGAAREYVDRAPEQGVLCDVLGIVDDDTAGMPFVSALWVISQLPVELWALLRKWEDGLLSAFRVRASVVGGMQWLVHALTSVWDAQTTAGVHKAVVTVARGVALLLFGAWAQTVAGFETTAQSATLRGVAQFARAVLESRADGAAHSVAQTLIFDACTCAARVDQWMAAGPKTSEAVLSSTYPYRDLPDKVMAGNTPVSANSKESEAAVPLLLARGNGPHWQALDGTRRLAILRASYGQTGATELAHIIWPNDARRAADRGQALALLSVCGPTAEDSRAWYAAHDRWVPPLFGNGDVALSFASALGTLAQQGNTLPDQAKLALFTSIAIAEQGLKEGGVAADVASALAPYKTAVLLVVMAKAAVMTPEAKQHLLGAVLPSMQTVIGELLSGMAPPPSRKRRAEDDDEDTPSPKRTAVPVSEFELPQKPSPAPPPSSSPAPTQFGMQIPTGPAPEVRASSATVFVAVRSNELIRRMQALARKRIVDLVRGLGVDSARRLVREAQERAEYVLSIAAGTESEQQQSGVDWLAHQRAVASALSAAWVPMPKEATGFGDQPLEQATHGVASRPMNLEDAMTLLRAQAPSTQLRMATLMLEDVQTAEATEPSVPVEENVLAPLEDSKTKEQIEKLLRVVTALTGVQVAETKTQTPKQEVLETPEEEDEDMAPSQRSPQPGGSPNPPVPPTAEEAVAPAHGPGDGPPRQEPLAPDSGVQPPPREDAMEADKPDAGTLPAQEPVAANEGDEDVPPSEEVQSFHEDTEATTAEDVHDPGADQGAPAAEDVHDPEEEEEEEVVKEEVYEPTEEVDKAGKDEDVVTPPGSASSTHPQSVASVASDPDGNPPQVDPVTPPH